MGKWGREGDESETMKGVKACSEWRGMKEERLTDEYGYGEEEPGRFVGSVFQKTF